MLIKDINIKKFIKKQIRQDAMNEDKGVHR